MIDAPRRQHRIAALAPVQAFGNAVEEQVGDLVHRQVAGGERLVLVPQLLGDLAGGAAPERAVRPSHAVGAPR